MKIKLNNKEITISKWKGKTKKDFYNAIIDNKMEELESKLVYDYIEPVIAFSTDEFKYILMQIRAHSLGNIISLQFHCDSCDNYFVRDIDLNEVFKPKFNNSNTIKTKKYEIKLGDIKNIEYYKEAINNDNAMDFYLRIESINDEEVFKIDNVVELFDNMDINDYNEILDDWENLKFKLDCVHDIKCDCGFDMKYNFDNIPGFFPKNWFE